MFPKLNPFKLLWIITICFGSNFVEHFTFELRNTHFFFRDFQEDMKVGHLTHVSEMEKKIETLARITAILKGVIQNKVM